MAEPIFFLQLNSLYRVTCSPSLAENNSRLLKNSEGNRNGKWIFCRKKEADVALFWQVSDKNEKDLKNLRSKLNLSIIPLNLTFPKQRTLKHETNKTDRDTPIKNHKP